MKLVDVKWALFYIGVGYFVVDSWLLCAFWLVKEWLVGFHVLWFPMPFSGFILFRQYYEFVSSLPGFEFIQFIAALAMLPILIIVLIFLDKYGRIIA